MSKVYENNPGGNNSAWQEMAIAGIFDSIEINYRFAEATLTNGVHRSFWPYAQSQQFLLPTSQGKVVISSTSALDTAAGTGAQAVTIEGYNDAGELLIEEIETAGLADSAESVNDYRFVIRAYVTRSGTRPTLAAVYSHAGDILVKQTGTSNVHAFIDVSGSGAAYGQTQQIIQVVPENHVMIVTHLNVRAESSKSTDFYLWKFTNPFSDGTLPTTSIIRNIFEVKNVSATPSEQELFIGVQGPAVVFATGKNQAQTGTASAILGYKMVDLTKF